MKRFGILAPFIVIAEIALSANAQVKQTCPAAPDVAHSFAVNIFTPQQEIYLGDVEAEQLEHRSRVIHDDELAAHLNRLVNRLVTQMPPTQLKFRVALVDLPNVNAFSLSGGRIYVTRKMIAFARNEDELASLLAHEMGHTLAHQQAIQTTRLFHDILGVTSVGDAKDIADKYNRMLDNLARNLNLLIKVSSQEEPHQYQADQVALYVLANAGYSPTVFAEFFDRLAQTHGKAGNWFTDYLGISKPNEKRLHEIHKSLDALPSVCRQITAPAPSTEFLDWQAKVIAYSGLGTAEVLTGVIAKKPLDPPLRTDFSYLRFSPDGQYAIAQDDSSIFVLSRDPFDLLFRMDAPDARLAQFTPDSKDIVFDTRGMRVERWNIEDQERTDIQELAIPEGCIATRLSPDGKLLACLNQSLDISLIEVNSGSVLFSKKGYFEPKTFGLQGDIVRAVIELMDAVGESTWLKMGFSPDARFFVASGFGISIAVDVNSRSQISLHGELPGLLGFGFQFIAADRIVVANRRDPKKSAILEFPDGKVVKRLPIGRQVFDVPTRGNYIILRPVKDAKIGLMDLDSGNIVLGVNKAGALDVYDGHVLTQKAGGEIGIYDLSTHKLEGQVAIPDSPLGSIPAWTVSSDLKWLALSATTRGAVWDLSTSKRLYYFRGFRGGYFDGDEDLYADFPKEELESRMIAKADLAREHVVPGISLEDKSSVHQHGRYLEVFKPAPNKRSLAENITFEVQDVRDGHTLWTRGFPKEAPSIRLNQELDTLVLDWRVEASAAKDEIKNNVGLQGRFAAMKDHKGAYLVEVLDPASGKLLGELFVDTGKGSFRVTQCLSQGDWVVIGDNENRTRVYSLSTGELKGTVFGTHSLISASVGVLIVENEFGQVDFYGLSDLNKRAHLSFPYKVSAWSFSGDGKRLLILTANQIAYTFDTNALVSPNKAQSAQQ
jgi:hypothetical protein